MKKSFFYIAAISLLLPSASGLAQPAKTPATENSQQNVPAPEKKFLKDVAHAFDWFNAAHSIKAGECGAPYIMKNSASEYNPVDIVNLSSSATCQNVFHNIALVYNYGIYILRTPSLKGDQKDLAAANDNCIVSVKRVFSLLEIGQPNDIVERYEEAERYLTHLYKRVLYEHAVFIDKQAIFIGMEKQKAKRPANQPYFSSDQYDRG